VYYFEPASRLYNRFAQPHTATSKPNMPNPIQSLDFLTQQFGHEKIIFTQVTETLIKARLHFAEQSCAEIHLQGAHLTQWQDTQGRENLFTSPTAVYQRGKAIRGGNPIIFPQFGPGKLTQHGFARNSLWRVIETKVTEQATIICLELTEQDLQPHVTTQWQHPFVLRLTLTLAETLTTQLQIKNTDNRPFSFTFGFHTYLAVEEIAQTQITGLSLLNYMDNLAQQQTFTELRNPVVITEFTDRCYQGIPAQIVVTDQSSGRKMVMQTQYCQDAFVWNPWDTEEKNFTDLAEGSYQQFVCIEPGIMKKAMLLLPETDFSAEQTLKRLD
jgi:glucose-6-phosphate 1-epimerase